MTEKKQTSEFGVYKHPEKDITREAASEQEAIAFRFDGWQRVDTPSS